MCHFYNKIRKNLLLICPILNLQGCKCPKVYIQMNFKKVHKFEDRLQESTRIRNKYPERIPVICEKYKNNDTIPKLDKSKYLVPIDLTIGQFMFVIRKRIKLSSEQAIFIFINGTIPSTNAEIYKIYESCKDEDGFLYVTYSGENTFGSSNL